MIEPLSPTPVLCADCETVIGKDLGPPDGWQLEDGRTVCTACCAADLQRFHHALSAARLENF